MNRFALVTIVALLALPASGASLAITDLPSSFLAGGVTINSSDGRIYSQVERAGVSAYSFTRNGQSRFLVLYDVFAPASHWHSTGLTGRVFLDVAAAYDLSANDHEVGVYFDQLSPAISDQFFLAGLFGDADPTFETMVLDADGIASGSAFYRREEYPDQVQSGNLSFLDSNGNVDGPFVCIECGIEFTFNLVFLDFSSGILNFNFDDPRPNLISAVDWFEGSMPYGYNLDIAVQPVPLPAAWLLLGGALMSLRMLFRHEPSQIL